MRPIPERGFRRHEGRRKDLIPDLILPILMQVVSLHFGHEGRELERDESRVISSNPIPNHKVFDTRNYHHDLLLSGNGFRDEEVERRIFEIHHDSWGNIPFSQDRSLCASRFYCCKREHCVMMFFVGICVFFVDICVSFRV